MSADKYFLDTNILVYSFDSGEPAKLSRSQQLIHEGLKNGRAVISYQVAQEFTSVARKKFAAALTFEDLEAYWRTTLYPLLLVHSSFPLFERALDVCRREKLSWYDSLVIAAAIQGACKVLYSEDFQHGRRFGDLVIANPFIEP